MKPSTRQETRPRVALLLPNLTRGGTECQAVELARSLPAAGWDPVVLVAEMGQGQVDPRQEAALQEAGIPIHRLDARFWLRKSSPAFWGNVFAVIGRTVRICRQERVRVLQSFLFWQNLIAVPAGLLLPGVPVLTGRRNTGEFKDRRFHYQVLENLANLATACVVGNSPDVVEDARRRESFLGGRLLMIPNAVDWERFHRAAPADLRALHPELAGASLIVGTVGNLKRQKRHDLFLRALAEVRARVPGAAGVIVGRDLGERPALEALCDELGLRGAVVFVGGVAAPEAYLRALDVFVLSSAHEGLPNALMEAMAAERACVSTDVGGVRLLLPTEEEGIRVPVGDVGALAQALEALLLDPARRNALGRRASLHMKERFGPSALASAHAHLYNALLQRKPLEIPR